MNEILAEPKLADLGDILEEAHALANKRNFVAATSLDKWDISLYYGPALVQENENVLTLEYTAVASTKHSDSASKPKLDTGCNPICVKFGFTTIITWSSAKKEDLVRTLQEAFDSSFNL